MLVVSGLLAGFSGINNFGQAGAGVLALMTTVIASAFMLGFKVSIVIALISVFGLSVFLYLANSGQLYFGYNFNEYMSSEVSWITVLFSFTYMVGILLYAYRRFSRFC